MLVKMIGRKKKFKGEHKKPAQQSISWISARHDRNGWYYVDEYDTIITDYYPTKEQAYAEAKEYLAVA